jgi:hypothetical protein
MTTDRADNALSPDGFDRLFSMSLRFALWACVLACTLAACDGEPPIIPLDGSRRDAGRRDGGSRDGGGRDAGPPIDAGPLSCSVAAADVHKLGSDGMTIDRTVGFASAGSAFGLVWSGWIDEELATRGVLGARLDSQGELGAMTTISAPPGLKRPPALVPVGTSWIAAYVDNAGGTFELYTQALAADLSASGDRHPVTSTAAVLEDNPVFFSSATGVLLAWVEEDTLTLARSVRVRTIADDGTPTGSAQIASDDAHSPGQVALAETSEGPVLLYGALDGEVTRLFLQPLTDSGAIEGAFRTLDEEMNADGTVDAALTSSGGAVVFGTLTGGVRPEVRFRALAGNGAPIGDERILRDGSGASIAYFAGGFVVSYRAPASGEDGPQVRALLVDQLGEVVLDVPVADASLEGGRTTVSVSGDGQIAIAWADRAGGGMDMRAALLRCGGGS